MVNKQFELFLTTPLRNQKRVKRETSRKLPSSTLGCLGSPQNCHYVGKVLRRPKQWSPSKARMIMVQTRHWRCKSPCKFCARARGKIVFDWPCFSGQGLNRGQASDVFFSVGPFFARLCQAVSPLARRKGVFSTPGLGPPERNGGLRPISRRT